MTRTSSSIRVACLEQFSGRNLGDCLALEQTMRDIESVIPGALFDVYSVIGMNPVAYYAGHNVRRVMMMPWNLSMNFIGFPALWNIPKADCVLVRGGIIFDMRLWDPTYSYLLNMFWVLRYARWLGKKVMMYGVGIGPLRTRASRAMARSACDCADVITTRDQDSLDLLREIGVTRPRLGLAADPAIRLSSGKAGLPVEKMAELGIPLEKPVLGISPTGTLTACSERGRLLDGDALARRIIEMVGRLVQDRGCGVVLMPTSDRDMAYSVRIAGGIPGAVVVDKERWGWRELLALMGHMRLLVGMRMHSLVLSVASGTAAVGIAYHPKVTSFMAELGCAELVLSPADLISGGGGDVLRQSWDDTDGIRQRQAKGRELLSRRAELSTQLFREMMGL